MTPQRKLILDYLINHETHPTAEMIYQDLQQQDEQISLATVYNTLEMLLGTQLVLAIDSDQDGKRHYDYFGHPHYHAICTNCGRIVDGENFDFSQLPNTAANETGYLITGYEATVKGLCPECQRKLENQK
ncbi:transcriptional repressor [Weissella uvarum]|nr:transcriptional repressor [Weissella uvarum]